MRDQLPPILFDTFASRLPEKLPWPYTKEMISSGLAGRMVYREGLQYVEVEGQLQPSPRMHTIPLHVIPPQARRGFTSSRRIRMVQLLIIRRSAAQGMRDAQLARASLDYLIQEQHVRKLCAEVSSSLAISPRCIYAEVHYLVPVDPTGVTHVCPHPYASHLTYSTPSSFPSNLTRLAPSHPQPAKSHRSLVHTIA